MTRQIRMSPSADEDVKVTDPPPPQDPAEALIGRMVAGRYRAEKILGRGGMGVVFEGTHVELEKKVAIKILLASYARDAEALTRFEREARNAAKLGHVHIAATLDLGRLDTGEPFLVMEHVAGTDLVSLVGSVARGEAPPERIVGLLEQVAAALDVVHRAGIIHRDVKAENVLLTKGPNGEDVVKLVDFGLATLADAERKGQRLTRAGMVIGTPEYIAPECARGASGGPESDQYSLAVLAFELFWGAPPFHGINPMDILMAKVSEDAPLLSSMTGRPGDALDEALARGLARDPKDRFASCTELVAAIRAGVERQRTLPPVRTNPPPRRPIRSDRTRRPPTKDELDEGEIAPPAVAAAVSEGASPFAMTAEREPSDTSKHELPVSSTGRWIALVALLLLLLGVGIVGVTWGGGGEVPVTTTQLTLPATTTPPPTVPPTIEVAPPPTTTVEPPPTGAEPPETTVVAPPPTQRPDRPDRDPPATTTSRPPPTTSDEPPETTSTPPSTTAAVAAADLVRNAQSALMRGQVGEARDLFRDATRIAPRHGPAWRGLGIASEQLHEIPEARSAFQRYLDVSPNASDAETIRARLARLGG